jgi:selenocysteine-specific elongation factor
MKSVIVGTAGHIDHGKTALVKALTGIDADRLEEEKRRGITIDIGFAHLELAAPNGEKLRLGFVDVPGHERFVRNMLAGVGGIDLVLLVIAADESIKPQTREHFDICRLLAVRRGITVLTKSDAVDAETLDVVKLEVEEFLRASFLDPNHSASAEVDAAGRPLNPTDNRRPSTAEVSRPASPIIAVSSLTGAGLPELKQALAKMAQEVPARDPSALVRLPIDRVFTMKGFGTVVTGTLVSGTIRKDDELEVFPIGKHVRVRGVQVHGESADKAIAGQRTALNLAGATVEDLARGMTLAPPKIFRATKRIDVSLSLLPSAKPLKDRARVHLHAYTSEMLAEIALYENKAVKPGEKAYAHLRLAEPSLLLPGDRFIMRQFSPVVTIGGGMVLDAVPLFGIKELRKLEKHAGSTIHSWSTSLEILGSGRQGMVLITRVGRRGARGLTIAEAVAETGWRGTEVVELVSLLVKEGLLVQFQDRLFAEDEFELAQRNLLDSVSEFHSNNPLKPGMAKGEMQDEVQRIFEMAPELLEAALLHLVRGKKLETAGELVRLPGHGVVMKDEEAESKKIIEQAFSSAGLQVPALYNVLAGLKVDKARAQKIVTLLLRDKVLVKISEELVFHQSALEALRKQIATQKSQGVAKIDVGKFKELTGVSRKYAIPLLEYLDRERVTRRVGDERVIL